MDCEKFDRILMDLLYDELDDLTRSGALRHVDHCQRCRELFHSLRATREVGTLPLVQPSETFEARVIELEQLAQRRLPAMQRLARALTIASGYAMRPQLAMAALLLLMIGSSLVLLQPRPGAHSSVLVTERGVPRAEPETVVVPLAEDEAPAPAPPPPAAREPLERVAAESPKTDKPGNADVEREMDVASKKVEDRAYAEAMTAFREQRHLEAQQQFDAIADNQGRNAASAELYAALATEQAQGCAVSLSRFDSVSARNPTSELGHVATWHSATCRAQLGQDRRATLDLQKLVAVPAYAQRAKQALSKLAAGEGEGIAIAEHSADDNAARGLGAGAEPVAGNAGAETERRAEASESASTAVAPSMPAEPIAQTGAAGVAADKPRATTAARPVARAKVVAAAPAAAPTASGRPSPSKPNAGQPKTSPSSTGQPKASPPSVKK